jgi:choline dehydrogenase-like flavoprotein
MTLDTVLVIEHGSLGE